MIQNCNILKIAKVFFNEPTKSHYLIEISRKSKLAHTSVKNYLKMLKKEGLIKELIEKKGKRSYPIYKANIEAFNYRQQKKIYNASMIIENGLIDYIKDICMPKTIILFGSYSRGEDIENSDIDIFVESKKQSLDLKKYENLIKRKLEIHFNENFKNYPIELKNNIINGSILYGYLEVYV